MILYHGSPQIVKEPKLAMGKPHNDYGQGFYCTENPELAKEWACQSRRNGYSNSYRLDTDGLKIMRITGGEYNVLNWIAILLKNRIFDITSPVAEASKEYLLSNFLPDTRDADVLIGYRADDSYFSFATDFINSTISVRDLDRALKLGNLGEQVVLVSEKAFENLAFLGYETADYKKYYYLRQERDAEARSAYRFQKKDPASLREDIFVLDIVREEMKDDDPRLRFKLS